MEKKTWQIFWSSWVAPVIFIIPVVYEELFGKLPKLIFLLVLVVCFAMSARPLGAFMLKRISFGQTALFGFVAPFMIWVVVVLVNIAFVRLLTR